MSAPGRIWPFVAGALMLVATHVQFRLPINFDVAWLLYGAGRMLDGATLYVDWVEPNPPLIVWLSAPFHIVGGWLGLPAAAVLRAGVIVMVAASLVLSALCLRVAFPAKGLKTDVLMMLLAFALISVVDHHFFQREHVLLAAVLPYLCAAAARARGLRLGRTLAVAVGVVAGVGLALKPFYLAVWVCVEAALVLRRSPRVLVRTETSAIAATGLLYGLAILAFAPEYLAVARLGALAYRTYGDPITVTGILADPRAIAAFILVLIAASMRRRYPVSDLRLVLLAALVGYVAAIVAQTKSFPNHWYPAEALLLLAGYATVADVLDVRGGTLRSPRRLAAAAGLAIVVLAAFNASNTVDRWRAAYQTSPFYLDEMRSLLEREPVETGFLTIGATMRASFPLAVVTGVPYLSRFHSMWFLGGSYPGNCHEPCRPFAYHAPGEMGPAERYQFDAVISDLARTRPDVLFIDLLPPQGLAGFDNIEYFSQSAEFRALFSSYTLEETVGGRYRAYRRLR